MAETAVVGATDGVGLDFLDGISAALYIWGEVHKVWDKVQRKSGEVKYYARMLVDDEPGMFQVNITDLPNSDIRYMASHERELVLLAVRLFVVEGSVYWKATELVTAESLAAGAETAAESILADLKKPSKKEAVV